MSLPNNLGQLSFPDIQNINKLEVICNLDNSIDFLYFNNSKSSIWLFFVNIQEAYDERITYSHWAKQLEMKALECTYIHQ